MVSKRNIEEMNEGEINLKDLMMHICLRWRTLLIWMLIGAIILGIGGTISQKKMKDEEIEEVKRVYMIYEQAVRDHESIIAYSNSSIKMKLDPYAVPTLSMSFYVDKRYQFTFPEIAEKDTTEAIVATLRDQVTTNAMYEEILQKLGWDVDVLYLQELISVESAYNTLHITAIAPKQTDCETIRNIIMDVINKQQQELTNQFGEFDIITSGNECKVKVNQELLEEQTSCHEEMQRNMDTTYDSLKAGLTSIQGRYMDDLREMHEENENNENSDELPTQRAFSIMYVVLGVLVGALLYCVWIAITYILSDYVYTVNDIERRYALRILSITNTKEKYALQKNGIDRFIYHNFLKNELHHTKEENIRLVKAEIAVLAKSNAINKLYLASTCETEEVKELQKLVREEYENACIVYGGWNVNDNPDALKEMSNCDAVILVEQIGISLHENIRHFIGFCDQNEIPVLGSIVVR